MQSVTRHGHRRRCRSMIGLWWLATCVSFWLVAVSPAMMSVVAATSSKPYDRANPLGYEEFVYTGERREPKTTNCFPPRCCTSKSQERTIRLTSWKGGEQTSQQPPPSGEELQPPPYLLNRWLKQRSLRGKITINLGGERKSRLPIAPRITAQTNHNDKSSNLALRDLHSPSEGQNSTTIKDRSSRAVSSGLVEQRDARKLIQSSDSPIADHAIPPSPNFEMSISLHPASFLRLTQGLVNASFALVAAFGGTLRLLAPMTVARRIISTIAYISYDYYNGRYIRTTYTKGVKELETYEIPSALRACGRMGLQAISMVTAGILARTVLYYSPTFLPKVASRYWFGSVWVSAVLLASLSTNYWMKRYPALAVYPAEFYSSDRLFSASTFLTRPWHILQWMKDPETWLLNLTRLQRHPSRRRRGQKPFQPDPLLFPSTWPPLHVVSAAAMVHAIAQTLPMKTGANTRILMQDYCLAVTLLDEWKRVFLYEHRITLGVIWSALSFAAFFVLSFSAAMEVGWVSSALLLLVSFACLVSGWMNAVVYSERHVQKVVR